ncbi:MAG TPA: hypothetical protein VJI97_03115 [Candidatus Nanoarchaeia archaeon]|nr:hypothetical protein [Candidatus Nanoarchaeia archaeon]
MNVTRPKITDLAGTLRVIIAIAESIQRGKDFSYLKSNLIDIYRSALSEFLMTNPDNPISLKYPDAKKVVEAYRVIERYLANRNR